MTTIHYLKIKIQEEQNLSREEDFSLLHYHFSVAKTTW